MELPTELQAALAAQLTGKQQSQIIEAAQEISLRYRTQDAFKKIQNQNEALAYAIARMPATFGAVYQSLKYSLECLEYLEYTENIDMQDKTRVSLIDAGAGTGAASWALNEFFYPDPAVCIENSDQMRRLGEDLMRCGGNDLKNAVWQNLNIVSDSIPGDIKADFVIASYVLNELDGNSQVIVAEKLWQATKKLLLFVEPGTPAGYGILKKIRRKFIEQGVRVIAPCPHENPCPLPENDWCHFKCRIQRHRLHKSAKRGEAPFEDEKYFYLALAKEPASGNASPAFRTITYRKENSGGERVLRHPYIGKGHVKLKLCTKNGIEQKTFSKRDKEKYKAARKAVCGDKL
jgi:ribosomal protein RSM22 (predicted rRNA methylase)